MKQIVSELFMTVQPHTVKYILTYISDYNYFLRRSVENLESKTSKDVEMINFLEQYHEASHLQERPNVWKRWVLLINMVPYKWQQAWDNFTIFLNVGLRIKYCNLISRKQWSFWKNNFS